MRHKMMEQLYYRRSSTVNCMFDNLWEISTICITTIPSQEPHHPLKHYTIPVSSQKSLLTPHQSQTPLTPSKLQTQGSDPSSELPRSLDPFHTHLPNLPPKLYYPFTHLPMPTLHTPPITTNSQLTVIATQFHVVNFSTIIFSHLSRMCIYIYLYAELIYANLLPIDKLNRVI